MNKNKEIPDWLRVCFQRALLGSVYPSIRKIAASLSDEKELFVKYYLDREPNEDDYENIEVLLTELSSFSTRDQIKTARSECVYSTEPLGKLDSLQGTVYSRKEF